MNEQRFAPCPWLLDDEGSIRRGRPRRPSRCGADATRPLLTNKIRDARCLVGAACAIRSARETALGPFAATIAPGQPSGDPALLYASDGGAASSRRRRRAASSNNPAAVRRIWKRAALVATLVVVVVVGGGAIIGAIAPAVAAMIGALSAPSDQPSGASPAPSAANVSPDPAPTSAPTPILSAAATPSPTASPSPSSGSGGTYVVRKGDDGLFSICLKINCGDWRILAELNNIPGPGYVIKPGQVLQLP